MKKNRYKLIISILIAVIVVLASIVSILYLKCFVKEQKIETVAPSALILTISMDRGVYKIGEPINVTVSLINIKNENITITKPVYDDPTLNFEIITPQGEYLHAGFIRTSMYFEKLTLCPGEKYSFTTNIKYWIFGKRMVDTTLEGEYDFSMEGIHSIRAVYIAPKLAHDPTRWVGTLYSNTLFFLIVS
ncbi:MAG: hypothetical protein AB1485_05145 [Candidatus Thermoplasmatota archaeon]